MSSTTTSDATYTGAQSGGYVGEDVDRRNVGTTSDFSDVTDRSTRGEGPIESTLGDAGAGIERRTGLDLDNSGAAGDRDRRDNF